MKFSEFLNESINDKGRLKALFVVGLPGSGKTYTISKLNGTISPRIINTDKMVEFYSKKLNVDATPENWKDIFRDKSKHTTVENAYNYINGMLPLFIDSTSNSSSNILMRSGLLESLGYDVGCVYVHTSLETALNRVQARNVDNTRKVDVDFIKRVHDKIEDDISFLRSKFDFFLEVDNSEDKLTNESMEGAFKKVASFYNKEISNPIGRRLIKTLEAEKESYLVPSQMTEEKLKSRLASWY